MKQFVKRAAVWLVLIVMSSMALGGCKESKYARVKDTEFEKTGYLIGTKRPEIVYGDRIKTSEYYYVVKNNSKKTVAIVGVAKAYGTSGQQVYEGTDDIAVLGPGETSVLMFTMHGLDRAEIDHVDCELQYYKTELTPVLGDIQQEVMRSEDKLTVLVTNKSAVDVQFLKGTVLFFDSENNVIGSKTQQFKEKEYSYLDVMKPETSRAVMFFPENWTKVLATEEFPGYDHAEVYLTYLDDPPENAIKKSTPFMDYTEDVLQVKEIHCKNTEGYQIHCLAVKNISDQTIGVHGVMEVCDTSNNPLAARTATVDALAPGQETILAFEFDVFDPLDLWEDYYGDYAATDDIRDADHVIYTLKYDPDPDVEAKSYSTKVLDYDIYDRVFKEVLVTYTGNEEILRPKVYGVFYDSEGNIVFAGYASDDTFNGGRSLDEFVVKDTIENGDTVIYGFSWFSRWLCIKETGKHRDMQEYEKADIYIVDR